MTDCVDSNQTAPRLEMQPEHDLFYMLFRPHVVQAFALGKATLSVPLLWRSQQIFRFTYDITYACECIVSSLVVIVNKQRNRIKLELELCENLRNKF